MKSRHTRPAAGAARLRDRPFVWLAAASLLVLVPARPARAENDYELVRALAEKGYTEFGPGPALAERAIDRLLASPDAAKRLEGKLARAMLLVRRARIESDLKERLKLFEDAEKVIEEFQGDAAAARHRLHSQSQTDISTAKSEIAKIIMKNPDLRPGKRGEVIKTMKENVQNLEEAWKKAWKACEPERLRVLDKINEEDPETAAGKAAIGRLAQELARVIDKPVQMRQTYYNAVIDLLEVTPADSAERGELAKKTVESIGKDLQEETMGNFIGIQMVFQFQLGRVHVLAGNLPLAAKDGFDKVINVEVKHFPGESAKTFVNAWRKQALYHKAKAALDFGKDKPEWQEGIGACIQFDYDFRDERETPLGAEMILIRAQIHAKIGEFAMAIQAAEKVLAMGGDRRARAELILGGILEEAERGGRGLSATAGAWLAAGKGRLRKAHEAGAEGRSEEAAASYGAAARYLRRSLAYAEDLSRSDDLERLEVAPEALFRMGAAYIGLKQFYEAAHAFGELRDRFGEKAIAKSIADDEKNADLLAKIKDFRLKAAANCTKVWAIAYKKARSEFNKKNYEIAMRAEIETGGGNPFDVDYLIAELRRADADAVLRMVRRGGGTPGQFKKAAQDYQDAIELYLKVTGKSSFFGTHFYKIGLCHYGWMNLLGAKDPVSEADEAKRKELASVVLRAFDDFEAHFRKNPPVGEKTAAALRKNQAEIAIIRIFLEDALGRLEGVVAAAKTWLKGTGLSPKNEAIVTWKLFDASRQLAVREERTPEQMKKDLGAMGKLRDRFKALGGRLEKKAASEKDEEKKVEFERIAKSARRRYAVTAQHIFAAYTGAQSRAKRAGRAALEKELEASAAEWMSRWIKDSGPELEENWRLVNDAAKRFYDLKQYGKAREFYQVRLLDKFGSSVEGQEDKLKEIPERSFGEIMDELKAGAVREVSLLPQCRRDIEGIRDSIFDRPEGYELKPGEMDEPRHYKTAMIRIEKFVIFLDALEGRARDVEKLAKVRGRLEAIHGELEFRWTMLRARGMVTECYIKLAEQAEASKDEPKRQEFLRLARENAERVVKFWPKDPELRMMLAKTYVIDPEYRKRGTELLMKVKKDSAAGSKRKWEATRLLCVALDRLADETGAKEHRELALSTVAMEVRLQGE